MSAGIAPPAIVLDSHLFETRWKRLFDTWNAGFNDEGGAWSQVDTLILLSGRQDEERVIPKTGQLHLWLFGYVFAETLLVALRDGTTFCLTGPRKLNYLKQLHYDKFVFLEKSTQDANQANVQRIIDAITAMRQKTPGANRNIGRIRGKGEEAVGAFAEQIEAAFEQAAPPEKYPVVSVHDPLTLLIAVHDAAALDCSAKAATLAVVLMREVLINRVEYVLDNEAKESHADIAARAEKALDDKKKQDRWKTKFDLDPTLLDLAYVNVQSGPKSELKSSSVPTSQPLCTGPGTIILSLGTKYKDLSANVIRTLLFNASKFTLEILEYAIAQLVPGRTFNEVYEAIRSQVQTKNPELFPFLTRSLGHTLGLEYRDPLLALNGRSTGVVQPGMVFNISIGFGNVPSKQDKSTYSIWLADTVEVRQEGGPKVLTSELDKRLKSINYEIAEEEKKPASVLNGTARDKTSGAVSAPSSAKSAKNQQRESAVSVGDRLPSESVVLRDRLRSRSKVTAAEDTEKLLAKQRLLRQRKVEEIRDRFRDGGGRNVSTSKRSVKKMTTLTAYRDASEFPKDLKPNRIYLDLIREAVFVPIPGFGLVPFHASTIRNVVCQAEDKKFYTVRLQFQVPGSIGFGYKSETNPFPDITGPQGMFVKEFIFRSSNAQLPQLCKSLKELQKRIKQREETGDVSMDLAAQAPLELNKRGGKRILLKSVMAKTGTNNRRVAGTLEAHINGLRFSGGRSETIDLAYANVKHAFFQPCENELVVLIHFHLKQPILVNKKKTSDIQFYTEVGAQADDLDQRRGRSSYDPDEIAEEQREREFKRRLNIEFKKFVESVEELVRSNGQRLEFEVPYRDLGFYGVPKNASQWIMPTAHCLVQLTEWPVFILTLDELELVSFERVYHGLRQFDMVFVFKDYARPVRQVTTIPVKSLDVIKRWLNEIDIVWYESKGNLHWAEVLKTIREDISGFVEDGAFEIFLGEDGGGPTAEGEGASESETDEDDEDYHDESSSDGSGNSGSDDDDSGDSDDDESLATEEDSAEGEDDDDEDDDNPTWEELEEKALQEDRKRGRSHHRGGGDDDDDDANGDSDDRKRSKKRKNR